MNPDVYSAEYQRMAYRRDVEQQAEFVRRGELHQKAVARRRKAKRGGRR